MLQRKALLDSLKAFLPNIVVREVLAAREGIKVARTGLRLRHAQRLQKLAGANGFHVVIGEHEGFPKRDRGKGGWCNTGHDEGLPGRGFHNIYIAATRAAARQTHDAETEGDDLAFGTALGIPSCCRRFYDSVKHLAAQEQNDFFPFSAPRDSTARPTALLNLGAQYFDTSLISHFPCSFSCAESILLAKAQARNMHLYDRNWLGDVVNLLNHACLYTEYSGIYLLAARAVKQDGVLAYSRLQVKGTSSGPIFRALAIGDTVHIASNRTLRVRRKSEAVADFRPTNLRLFAPEPITVQEAIK